jgi:hypothetical protein
MHRRLLLPLLLALTLLQGLVPLLHAHRDAPQFVGAVHVPVAAALVDATADGETAAAHRAALVPSDGALVTAVDASGPQTLPDPVAPAAASGWPPPVSSAEARPGPARADPAPPADPLALGPPPRAPPRA